MDRSSLDLMTLCNATKMSIFGSRYFRSNHHLRLVCCATSSNTQKLFHTSDSDINYNISNSQSTLHKSQCVVFWLMGCGQIHGWFWLHINNSHNNAPPHSITSQLSTYHFSPSRCDSRSLVSPIIALLLRWVMVPAAWATQTVKFYFESVAISREMSSSILNNAFWNHW